MSSVKLIAMPPGQAPEEVRKEWVGLVIPLPEQETGGYQMGVRGGKSQNAGGYQVDTREALQLLYDKTPAAAEWFMENAMLGSRLVFAREVCELVP
jgi:hypothetical protein